MFAICKVRINGSEARQVVVCVGCSLGGLGLDFFVAVVTLFAKAVSIRVLI